MNYYLLIPLFIIIILFFPIKLEGRFAFNLFDLTGAFGFFLYNIKLDHQEIWIKHRKIIAKKDNKVESKEIELDSDEILFIKIFISQIKDKTRLRLLSVFYNLGLDDAFTSAMVGGYINSLLLIFFTSIKNSKPTASLGVYDTISYNQKICQFSARIILSISLFDVVYSFIRSVILTRKTKKEKETT